MIEFNSKILNQWRNVKVRYLVTEEVLCTEGTEEAEFIIYPFKSVEDAESFILHKTRGTPFDLQETIVSYDIEAPEVVEIAKGIPYCKYYLNIPPPKKNEL